MLIGSVAARRLGIAQRTLLRWADEGKIKTERTPGGWRLFPESEITRLKQELADGRRRKVRP